VMVACRKACGLAALEEVSTMRLTRSQALFLSKILFHYDLTFCQPSAAWSGPTAITSSRLHEISSALNDFLGDEDVDADLTMDSGESGDPCAVCGTHHRPHCKSACSGKCSGCKSHEKDEDDVQDEVEEETGSEDQETEVEGDEEEEEDDLPEYDEVVDCEDLHALSKCKTVGTEEKSQTLEFEACEGGTVDLLIDAGSTILTDVTCVKREAKKLAVWTGDGELHGFDVKSFPKDWSKLLKVNVVYATCEDE
jgi:hypothetical protein